MCQREGGGQDDCEHDNDDGVDDDAWAMQTYRGGGLTWLFKNCVSLNHVAVAMLSSACRSRVSRHRGLPASLSTQGVWARLKAELVRSLDNAAAQSPESFDLVPPLLYVTSHLTSSPPLDQDLTSSLSILLQNYAITYLVPHLPSTLPTLTMVVTTLSNTSVIWDASSFLVYSSSLIPPFPQTESAYSYITAITSEYTRLVGTSAFNRPEHEVVNALVPWNKGVRQKAWRDNGEGGRDEVTEWTAEAVRRGEEGLVDEITMENVKGGEWGFLF